MNTKTIEDIQEQKEFKKELKALLIRYNAEIEILYDDDCSDTHEIYNVGIAFFKRNTTYKERINHKANSLAYGMGYSLDSSDL